MTVQLSTVQLTVGLPDVPLPQPKEQSGAAIKAKVKIRILEVLIENCPFCRQDMLRICWDGHSLHASDPQAQVLQRVVETVFRGIEVTTSLRQRSASSVSPHLKTAHPRAAAGG